MARCSKGARGLRLTASALLFGYGCRCPVRPRLYYVPVSAGVVSKTNFPGSKLGTRLDRCRISTPTT